VFGSPKARACAKSAKTKECRTKPLFSVASQGRTHRISEPVCPAHELQLHLLLDEIIEIADDANKDVKLAKCDEPLVATIKQGNIARSRLRRDTRHGCGLDVSAARTVADAAQ
jgi:hypothetical protein